MRLIALFFSFYVLLLAVWPCAEMPENDRAHDAPVSQSSSSQDHDQNHDDCNDCSPFCTCNCCATPMICQMEMVDLQVSTIVRKHETNYPTLFVTQQSGDIWQPPQLS